MIWKLEELYKNASKSDYRLIDVFEQTYPQFLKMLSDYESILKSEKDINDHNGLPDHGYFIRKIYYTVDGKKYFFVIQIANSKLFPSHEQYPSGYAEVKIQWMTIDYHRSHNINRTFTHELAHLLQGRFGGREGNKWELNPVVKESLVDYAYRFYEIHARWSEIMTRSIIHIKEASRGALYSEDVNFAIMNNYDDKYIKHILTIIFFGKTLESYYSVPRYRENGIYSSGSEASLAIKSSSFEEFVNFFNLKSKLLEYYDRQFSYYLQWIDPRTIYAGPEYNDGYYVSGIVKPKDDTVDRYLKKLRHKFIDLCLIYMKKEHKKLIDEALNIKYKKTSTEESSEDKFKSRKTLLQERAARNRIENQERAARNRIENKTNLDSESAELPDDESKKDNILKRIWSLLKR